MLTLEAKIRSVLGRKTKTLRKQGLLPAVLYGPKTKNQPLQLDEKEFERAYQEAGESSLISLKVGKESFKVLIHQLQLDPLSGKILHVDFYQPSLTETTEVKVPLSFEGEAPAIKELGGTLVKNISEIEVKALPQDLPHEIKVDLSGLKTFEDHILVKDLVVDEKVEVLRDPEETVVQALPAEKVEEELEKPIEEKPEEPEKVEEKKEREEEVKEEGEEQEKKEEEEKLDYWLMDQIFLEKNSK